MAQSFAIFLSYLHLTPQNVWLATQGTLEGTLQGVFQLDVVIEGTAFEELLRAEVAGKAAVLLKVHHAVRAQVQLRRVALGAQVALQFKRCLVRPQVARQAGFGEEGATARVAHKRPLAAVSALVVLQCRATRETLAALGTQWGELTWKYHKNRVNSL
jgi:hypothetical protein